MNPTTKDNVTAMRAALIRGPSIQLYSGGYFDFANPERTPVSIYDIARGLANECRYGGQCRYYSVAEHSVLSSYMREKQLASSADNIAYTEVFVKRAAYAALMHDAHESVAMDVMKPLKEILPDYQAVEERVEEQFAKWFDYPFPIQPEVKLIDVQMLLVEKEQLLGNSDVWTWCEGLEKPAWTPRIECWGPDEAYRRFLSRYQEITGEAVKL